MASMDIFAIDACFVKEHPEIDMNAHSISLSDMEKDSGVDLFPHVKKINNDFYVGKIRDKNLCAVMERVTKHNIDLYLRYATQQAYGLSRLILPIFNRLDDEYRNLFSSDGRTYFANVLEMSSYEQNEIWVGYITRDCNPQPISDDVKNYSIAIPPAIEEILKTLPNYKPNYFNNTTNSVSFAEFMEMFVTVVTSPHALLATYLGISYPVERVHDRTKGIYSDLHTFLAICMSCVIQKEKL